MASYPMPNANWYYQPTVTIPYTIPNQGYSWPAGQQPITSTAYSRQQPPTGNLIPEVDGVEGANAFPLGANSSILLLDKKNPYVYLKTTDAAGYPSVERFRVTPDPIEELSHEEVESMRAELARLKETVAKMKEANDGEPDIRQPAVKAVTQPVQSGQPDAGRAQGGYDWGYQPTVRPDAGQPQP